MKKNEYRVVENSVMNMLNEEFMLKFEHLYKNFSVPNKWRVLKYIAHLYRKWFYSTLIDGALITPCTLAEYGSGLKNVYSVINTNSINRMGSISIKNIEYSVDNHPICCDFRALIDKFKMGCQLDENMALDFSEIKKIKSLTNFDYNYVAYLIMLGIDMGFIERMASVGIEIYCTTKSAAALNDMDNRELLKCLVDCAVKIAVSYIFDEFDGSKNLENVKTVYGWIKKPVAIDEIFENVYGEMDVDFYGDNSFEEMDEYDRNVAVRMYARGMDIDKWFITPFGYYFRLIDCFYMYEFSYFDEIVFLVNALSAYDVVEDEITIDSALYSPCTRYKLSKIGAEFFGIEYKNEIPIAFRKMSVDEVLKGALGEDLNSRDKILDMYIPEFNVVNLSIRLCSNNKLMGEIAVKEDMTLDELSDYILKELNINSYYCQSYRFYKLPESPFTEYTPSFMEKRGPHTEDYRVMDVLEESEGCFYELIMLNSEEKPEAYVFDIEVTEINKSESI